MTGRTTEPDADVRVVRLSCGCAGLANEAAETNRPLGACVEWMESCLPFGNRNSRDFRMYLGSGEPITTQATFGEPEVQNVRADNQTRPHSGCDWFDAYGGQFDLAPKEQAEKAGGEQRQAGFAAVFFAVSGDERNDAHRGGAKHE
jgi:hypothetical protein